MNSGIDFKHDVEREPYNFSKLSIKVFMNVNVHYIGDIYIAQLFFFSGAAQKKIG